VIFVTVGSVFPFERLIRAMDEWAGLNPQVEVFAQTGNGEYQPLHMRWERMLSPAQFNDLVARTELLVAHAGTGSMIAAAEQCKPMVLLPRLARLREHTTDHQVHTARWLADRPGVFVAESETFLGARIADASAFAGREQALPSTAPQTFINKIRTALVS
jgi:UDP-N-acetylglucosamine transferase subunit ALG13